MAAFRAAAVAALGVGLLLGACGEVEPAPRIDGTGRVRIEPGDPVRVRRVGDWRFAYQAAAGGVAAGGAVAFQVSPYWGWSPPQTERPWGRGYTSFELESKTARIAVAAGRRRNELVFRVDSGRLAPGERLVIRYANARSDSFAEKRQEFVFRVDGDGDGSFAEIESQPALEILPGEAKQAWVVAPALAPPAAPVRARASLLDRADNLVRAGAIEGEPPRVRYRDGGTGLAGVSERIWPEAPDAAWKLYWGDLHGHSAWSDGTGEPEDYYRYARDAAGLDFAALTDHDVVGLRALDAGRWAALRRVTDAFDDAGRFVTFFGWEYTNPRSGHLTVLSPSSELPVLPTTDPETDTPAELWARLDALPDLPVLAIPHHVGGSTAAVDWDQLDDDHVALVEICSVHGSSECYDCPRRVRSPRRGSFALDALRRGWRFAFIASGDSHNGHPGRTFEPYPGGLVGVWARGLDRQAIWDALTHGRTFATSGPRIVPVLEHRGAGRLHAQVLAAGTLAAVELVKNGEPVLRRDGPAKRMVFDWSDPHPPRRGDFYYLRVTQTDRGLAWTSPVFVE